MMANTIWPQSTLMGWHIHLLSGVVLTIGIVLFIVWAAKTLDKKSLATWALIFVIIGILGTFLTTTWSGKFWSNMMGGENMIEEMQEHMGINQ